MPQSPSPLRHPIGLGGVVRWLMAVAATVAVGVALSAGQYGLALAGAAFLIVAVTLAARALRTGRSPKDLRSPR